MTCMAIHNGVLDEPSGFWALNLAGLGEFQGLQTGSSSAHIRH